jgi:hypothetical protein
MSWQAHSENIFTLILKMISKRTILCIVQKAYILGFKFRGNDIRITIF